MVPNNHPVLSLSALDAEAQGLLDRLLSILHEDPWLVSFILSSREGFHIVDTGIDDFVWPGQ